jgi:hypothetical protein
MIRGIILIFIMLSGFFGCLYLLFTQIHWATLPLFCLAAAFLPQTSGDMRISFVALSVLSLASIVWFL